MECRKAFRAIMGEFRQYEVGSIVAGKYRVDECKPAGGMGRVVVVTRLVDGEKLALKYCRYDDQQHLDRFRREARIMQQIEHENVLGTVRVGLKHMPPYFTMELAAGSIEEELGVLAKDEAAALQVFHSICLGIHAIHSRGAVHRDIKPANALRMRDGKIRVCDLGLARFEERDTAVLTQTRMILGTEAYLAPEQRAAGGSRSADRRTDVYQLGKTLYQLVTGKEPILIDLTQLSPGLSYIVKKATRENPDDRFQSVAELMDSIEMYKRAIDPDARPVDAFEAVLEQVEDRVSKGRIREDELNQLLLQLTNLGVDDDGLLRTLFDRIPGPALGFAAGSMPAVLEPVLTRYVRSIDASVSGEAFSYAEHVASKMQAVFETSISPEITMLALQAALIAAVDLNRFAAMQVFDEMLVSIKDDGVAMQVADMLKHQKVRYNRVAARLESGRLHPAIRKIRQLVG